MILTCREFSWLIIDVWGPIPSWVVPSPVMWSSVYERKKRSPLSGISPWSLLQVPALSSCFVFRLYEHGSIKQKCRFGVGFYQSNSDQRRRCVCYECSDESAVSWAWCSDSLSMIRSRVKDIEWRDLILWHIKVIYYKFSHKIYTSRTWTCCL